MNRTIVFLFFVWICIHSQAQNSITLRVDMNKPIQTGLFEASSGDRVILRGSFNNWQGDDYVLNDMDGDHIYSGTFMIEGYPGTGMEYKFIILKASGISLWEKYPNPENPPDGNRTFTVNENPLQLDLAGYDFDKYYLALAGKVVIFSVGELQYDFNQGEIRRSAWIIPA